MWVGAPPLAVPPCCSAAPGPDREAAAPVLRCHQVVCRPAGGGGRGDAGVARAARRRQPQGRAWLLQYFLFLLLWQPLPVLYDPSVEYVSSFPAGRPAVRLVQAAGKCQRGGDSTFPACGILAGAQHPHPAMRSTVRAAESCPSRQEPTISHIRSGCTHLGRAAMTQQQDGKEEEREAQRQYWKEHSGEATVEAMMLDSQAADIDKMERPEVGPWAAITAGLRSPSAQEPSAPCRMSALGMGCR